MYPCFILLCNSECNKKQKKFIYLAQKRYKRIFLFLCELEQMFAENWIQPQLLLQGSKNCLTCNEN